VDVVPADVAELGALLALRGVAGADVVVSGVGWSATRPGREDSLVPVVARSLADDGVFVQFAYVATSPVVWRNLPPAVVHRAARPRR
jgi:phosphatidylethanolamine/phosphatidyl-N-methylethanolamine N-methyltransferase